MLHTQIENDELVERYVRNRLTPEDRQAFEEHYFACDECFAKVQVMERFVAGVRDAAERGALADAAAEASRRAPAWALWAFAGSSAAAIALAAVVAWALLVRIPSLQRNAQVAMAETQSQQQVRALQTSVAAGPGVQANVPLVMLEATRGEEAATAVLPADSRQLIVWVEIGPTRYRTYRMEVDAPSGKRVIALDGLSRGPYGALAASIPTAALQAGIFRVRLIGQAPPPASLVSEYRLQIRRP
jgi:hypothetical protein